MKEKVKAFFCVLFLLGALPYIITMLLQGKEAGEKQIPDSGIQIQETSKTSADEASQNLNIEEYLVGVTAQEIPITYETEALKAQAVAARTNLMAALENGEELPKTMSQEELLKLWGKDSFNRNYQRLADAVAATEGEVLVQNGAYIYAAFHAVSGGKTRNAREALGSQEMGWLESVDSNMDITSEDYLKVVFLDKEELTGRLQGTLGDFGTDVENPLEALEITARDEAGYVTQIKAGEKTVTGEEFRNALGLNSACFYMKEVEGRIRFVTKGLGHGLGMSQYGANELALEGYTYQEILNYYFKNIEISD